LFATRKAFPNPFTGECVIKGTLTIIQVWEKHKKELNADPHYRALEC
jgi:hypothetical protein